MIRGEIQDTGNIYDSEGVDPDDLAPVIEVPDFNLEVMDKENISAGSSTSVQPLTVNINTPLNSGSVEQSFLKRTTGTVRGPPRKKVRRDLKFGNQDELEIAQMKKQLYVEAMEIEREILREKQKLEREILQEKLETAQVQKEAAEEEARLRMEILEIEKKKKCMN